MKSCKCLKFLYFIFINVSVMTETACSCDVVLRTRVNGEYYLSYGSKNDLKSDQVVEHVLCYIFLDEIRVQHM